MKPKYIVFEGLNGCGKNEQASRFERFLYDSSRNVFTSRIRTPNTLDENGKGARELLRQSNAYSDKIEAVRLFGENHKTTARHVIELKRMGHHIISDRNYLSTFAYQHAQKVPYKDIAKAVNGSAIPDITFLIDVPAEVAAERLSKRKDGEGRRKFDKDIEFLSKVRENYLWLSQNLNLFIPDKSIRLINGDQPIEAVFEEVKKAYETAFKS